MKVVTIIIEKANDGSFSAYMEDNSLDFGLCGFGDTAEEAKNDLFEAYEEIKEIHKTEGKETTELDFNFKYDIH